MDPLLMTITVVSLGVALVTSVMAWRSSQEEKRRAGARVAALSAAVALPMSSSGPDAEARTTAEPPQVPAAPPWRKPDRLDAPSRDVAVAATEGSIAIHAGFLGAEAPARETGPPQRWLAAAAAVIALVLGGFVTMRMSTPVPGAEAANPGNAPLELMSLRHEREGANLSVAGLVRNPPAAPVVERLTAVVFLFDQQGQFVTSAKAPIDFLKLTAGDESPFVVKVAAPQTVTRYRVSFRTEDGTRPHVDRRGDPPVTAPVALTRQ